MRSQLMYGLAVLSCFLAGCITTFDPLTIEKTERDEKVCENPGKRTVAQKRYEMTVNSTTTAHASDTSLDDYLAQQVKYSLVNFFANLGWLKPVDSQSGIMIPCDGSKAVKMDAGIPVFSYALYADSHISYIAKQGWKRTSRTNKARGAEVETEFRLVNENRNVYAFSAKIKSKVADVEKGNVRMAISQAAELNAQKFARIIASMYLPEVKVIETRGDGRYARVRMGRNYCAVPKQQRKVWWPYKYFPLWRTTETLMPDAEVEFFVLEHDEGLNKSVKKVIARGHVVWAEERSAWVEVDNYKDNPVYIGHWAMLANSQQERVDE